MPPKLIIEVLGDTSHLERSFRRSSRASQTFSRDIGRAGRGAASAALSFRGLGRAIAFTSGAFLGGAGLGMAMRGAFTELNESRKVTAQTNAVLKSTGQIAGVTAKHVDELGQSLLRKTGIDDEAIRSTANLLLTFKNLRNVAGRGNDIFDQATKSTLDLSVAMHGDLQGAAVMVGKALQDPIRGITALKKRGVDFSVAQRDQIKTLVQTGRTMTAQKIILQELREEFGGSAEAAGRVQPWNLLRETLRNLSAEIATGALPKIIEVTDRMQKWLDNPGNTDKVKKAFADAADAIGEVARVVQRVVGLLGGLKNALIDLGIVMGGFKAASLINSLVAIGTAAGGATGKVTGLRAALLGLRSLGTIALPIASIIGAKELSESKTGKRFGLDYSGIDLGKDILKKLGLMDSGGGTGGPNFFGTGRSQLAAAAKKAAAQIRRTLDAATFGEAPPGAGLSAAERKAKAAGQKRAVALAKKAFQDRARAIQDALRTTQLGDPRGPLTIGQINQAMAGRDQAAQFRALGFTSEGGDRAPGVQGLRKRLGALSETIKGTVLDTPKIKAVMNRIRKVLAGGFGDVSKDVRARMKEMLDGISDLIKDGPVKRNQFRRVNSNALIKALGIDLTADETKRLRAAISRIGAGGMTPGLQSAAFSGAGAAPIVVHTTVELEGRVVAKNVTKHQQKHQTRRSSSRRGPHAGRALQ